MKHIIQIGACNGNDHVTPLISKPLSDTTIHLIEPLEHNFIQLQKNYKDICVFNKILFYQCAISTFDGKLALYAQNSTERADEHCSVNHNHLVAHGHENKIRSVDIECYTLNSFILNNNIEGIIEHLFIDTEGHDCDILLSTNFKSLDIKYITFEQVHADGPFNQGEKLFKTINYLKSYKYRIHTNQGFDITLTRD